MYLDSCLFSPLAFSIALALYLACNIAYSFIFHRAAKPHKSLVWMIFVGSASCGIAVVISTFWSRVLPESVSGWVILPTFVEGIAYCIFDHQSHNETRYEQHPRALFYSLWTAGLRRLKSGMGVVVTIGANVVLICTVMLFGVALPFVPELLGCPEGYAIWLMSAVNALFMYILGVFLPLMAWQMHCSVRR